MGRIFFFLWFVSGVFGHVIWAQECAEDIYKQSKHVKGKPEEKNILEASFALAGKEEDMETLLRVTSRLANIYHHNKAWEKEETIIIRGLTHARTWKVPASQNEMKFTGWLNLKLGRIYYRQQRFLEAISTYEKAGYWLEKAEYNPQNCARFVYKDLANIYTRLGDYERALLYLNHALDLLESESDRLIYAYLLSDKGIAFIETNQLIEAEETLNQTLQLAQRLGHSVEGDVFLNLAKVAQISGESAKSEAMATSALKIYRRDSSLQDMAIAHLALGVYTAAQGKISEARTHYQTATNLEQGNEGSFKGRQRGKILAAFADFEADQQKRARALELFQQAIQTVVPQFSPQDLTALPDDSLLYEENLLYESLLGMAEIFEQEYAETSQTNYLLQALEAREKVMRVEDLLRGRFAYEGPKLQLQAERHARTGSLLRLVSKLSEALPQKRDYYLDKAFQYLERNKALVMEEESRGARAIQRSANSEVYQELSRQIIELEHARMSATLEQEQDSLRRLLNKLQLQEARLVDPINAFFSQNRAEDQGPRLSLSELQKQLQKGQELRTYYWGDTVLYCLAANQQRVRLTQVTITEADKQNIQSLRTQLARPDASLAGLRRFVEDSYNWKQRLLAPLSSVSPSAYIFLLDGPLVEIPFETLLDEPVAIPKDLPEVQVPDQWRALPYLFLRSEIAYAFSARDYFQERVVSGNTSSLLLGIAPTYQGLQQLVYNQPEVKAILAEQVGKALLGTQATIDSFRSALPEYDILHLAMHGYPDTTDPSKSYLLFSDDGKAKDHLYAFEIYQLPVEARLTVLSACETGYGKLARGEGVLSLARAFRQAGSRSVIMSLWLADGKSSEVFWPAFYAYQQETESDIEALGLARQDYLREAPPHRVHPYYWAGFVWNGSSHSYTANFSTYLGIASLLLGLLAGVYLIWRKSVT
ncbi:MAG: CHAT domain-containing protein [Bacteroidota bacterium]